MNYRKERISLINGQIIALIINLIVLAISIFVLYSERKDLENEPIISEKKLKIINLINQTVIFLIVLYFLYVSYKTYQIAKLENKNIRNNFLSLITSILATIATLISYYVTINDEDNVTSNISF